jgi:hypothetical protein
MAQVVAQLKPVLQQQVLSKVWHAVLCCGAGARALQQSCSLLLRAEHMHGSRRCVIK